jgi:hypothetical protein
MRQEDAPQQRSISSCTRYRLPTSRHPEQLQVGRPPSSLCLFGLALHECLGLSSGAFATSIRKTLQRRIVCIVCRDFIGVQPGNPQGIGGPFEAGGYLDSQAPCVVYHQIGTPFPADGLLCSDRYLRTFSRSGAVFISPHAISLGISVFHPQDLAT